MCVLTLTCSPSSWNPVQGSLITVLYIKCASLQLICITVIFMKFGEFAKGVELIMTNFTLCPFERDPI